MKTLYAARCYWTAADFQPSGEWGDCSGTLPVGIDGARMAVTKQVIQVGPLAGEADARLAQGTAVQTARETCKRTGGVTLFRRGITFGWSDGKLYAWQTAFVVTPLNASLLDGARIAPIPYTVHVP